MTMHRKKPPKKGFSVAPCPEGMIRTRHPRSADGRAKTKESLKGRGPVAAPLKRIDLYVDEDVLVTARSKATNGIYEYYRCAVQAFGRFLLTNDVVPKNGGSVRKCIRIAGYFDPVSADLLDFISLTLMCSKSGGFEEALAYYNTHAEG